MTKACSSPDLLARIVAVEAAQNSLKDLLSERDRRYQDRADAQDDAVAVAMASADRATAKAETATERRLEGLNELRSMAEDQARNYARSDEMKIINDASTKRLDELTLLVRQQLAHGGGVKETIGYVVGVAGLLIAAITGYFHK